ncbi:hypothetical protein PRIPAC_74992 [Pristionchus pacificus]|uniref:Uncharacterized protein n=1 Tax=Pristionchus pacificus TaxID=54126 RepID=A0A2A6B4U6_PRIPA|nr:hypothetical protein PRIPAC_74992 [Pristionchus pacificus]|eukprot:PDM60881.1 hypothetical protein PRIPAC_54687 [Pristionchus pacificus]
MMRNCQIASNEETERGFIPPCTFVSSTVQLEAKFGPDHRLESLPLELVEKLKSPNLPLQQRILSSQSPSNVGCSCNLTIAKEVQVLDVIVDLSCIGNGHEPGSAHYEAKQELTSSVTAHQLTVIREPMIVFVHITADSDDTHLAGRQEEGGGGQSLLEEAKKRESSHGPFINSIAMEPPERQERPISTFTPYDVYRYPRIHDTPSTSISPAYSLTSVSTPVYDSIANRNDDRGARRVRSFEYIPRQLSPGTRREEGTQRGGHPPTDADQNNNPKTTRTIWRICALLLILLIVLISIAVAVVLIIYLPRTFPSVTD